MSILGSQPRKYFVVSEFCELINSIKNPRFFRTGD